jgi:hypothetical protein
MEVTDVFCIHKNEKPQIHETKYNATGKTGYKLKTMDA